MSGNEEHSWPAAAIGSRICIVLVDREPRQMMSVRSCQQAVRSRLQGHDVMQRHAYTRTGLSAPSRHSFRIVLALVVALGLSRSAGVSVVVAAVSVAAIAVSITASAVETPVDVAAAGLNAVVGEGDEKNVRNDEDWVSANLPRPGPLHAFQYRCQISLQCPSSGAGSRPEYTPKARCTTGANHPSLLLSAPGLLLRFP